MKVYVVIRASEYYGEDGNVVAVFDTAAKAIAFCGERIEKNNKYDYTWDEFEVE